MLIDDIDKALDMQGEVSLPLDHAVSMLLATHDVRGIIDIRPFGDRGMSIEVQGSEINKPEIHALMSRIGREGNEGTRIIDIAGDGTDIPVIVEQLIKIPSIAIDFSELKKGRVFLYFRFHHNNLKEVSDALLNSVRLFEGFEIEYLSESKGLKSTIHKISELTNLYYMEMVTNPPKEEIYSERNPVYGTAWTREIKHRYLGEIHGIYYTDKPAEDKFSHLLTKISDDGRVYYAVTGNPLIDYISEKENELGISTVSRIQKLEGDSFKIGIVLPEIHLKRHLNLLSEVSEKFPEWSLVLTDLQRLDYKDSSN